MRKYLFVALLGLSVPAFADSYDVTFGWTDPTTYLPNEVPTFEARYRIADGQVTVIPGLITPGGKFSIIANPGETIEVALRTCNGALCGNWTEYAVTTAMHGPTTPMTPINGVITVIRTGP